MQVTGLHTAFDKMQKVYGDPNLFPIYGAGCVDAPKVCFVFMNPTGKNVASQQNWKGLRAPWVGTKNIWKLFYRIGLLSDVFYEKTQALRASDWTASFTLSLYEHIASQGVYMTNIAKCTQSDAKHVSDAVYRDYLPLLEQEILHVNPDKIILFGNQVSSIFLGENISVSKCRKKAFIKTIDGKKFEAFPVYYPVGQGMRHI